MKQVCIDYAARFWLSRLAWDPRVSRVPSRINLECVSTFQKTSRRSLALVGACEALHAAVLLLAAGEQVDKDALNDTVRSLLSFVVELSDE